MSEPGQNQHFDILLLPETNLILLASVIEPLRAANRIAGRDLYRWKLHSPDGTPVHTTCEIPIAVAGAFRPARETDPLFVLSSYDWKKSVTRELKAQLSRTARHRSLIAGIETGTFVLAEAGLLNGSRATIHWEDLDAFSLIYPDVELVRDRFVIDGKRITTGGPVPTLDLMLELIRRVHGHTLALEVSRLFLYEYGGNLSSPAIPSDSGLDPRVQAAVRLMENTTDAPLVLTRLAKRVGVSVRHLQDIFQSALGVGPHAHYLALRLNAARRKVIETSGTIADIAAETGFNSASALSRSYRAQYRESPSETRRRVKRRDPVISSG
jgi:transcriptional regulator GlxA family with amidase domain